MHCLLPRPRRLVTGRVWVRHSRARRKGACSLPRCGPARRLAAQRSPRSSVHDVAALGVHQGSQDRQIPKQRSAAIATGSTWHVFCDASSTPQAEVRGKPIVEIHVDQRCVGELTPQMSQRFLPMIQHSEKRGLTSACRAQIMSSSVAAEVRICAVPLLLWLLTFCEQFRLAEMGRYSTVSLSDHQGLSQLDDQCSVGGPSAGTWRRAVSRLEWNATVVSATSSDRPRTRTSQPSASCSADVTSHSSSRTTTTEPGATLRSVVCAEMSPSSPRRFG